MKKSCRRACVPWSPSRCAGGCVGRTRGPGGLGGFIMILRLRVSDRGRDTTVQTKLRPKTYSISIPNKENTTVKYEYLIYTRGLPSTPARCTGHGAAAGSRTLRKPSGARSRAAPIGHPYGRARRRPPRSFRPAAHHQSQRGTRRAHRTSPRVPEGEPRCIPSQSRSPSSTRWRLDSAH